MIEIHSTQLPPEITYAQITSGIGTTPVLFTPAKAKGMIEDRIPPEITATIFVVTVSHLNYLLCAVYKFTKTLGVKCSSARISPADSPRA
jgi:hypothetical protein